MSRLLPLLLLPLAAGCGRPDYYVPASPAAIEAPFRTMAEHDSLMDGRSWPYLVELEAAPGALFYYGSWHTTDPDDPQIADLQARWAAFRPTVAVTENRPGFYAGGLRSAVSFHGEFGALKALARADGVPLYTLEPTWDVEVADATEAFPVEEVTLFYTLRVFLNERPAGASSEEIDDLARHLLRKRGSRPGLEGSLPDLAALDALWDERFAHLGPWRSLPPEAIHPSAEPTRLSAIANRVNELRDRHAARVILDLLARGERVFALAGGSHVVKQEPVLRAGTSGETY